MEANRDGRNAKTQPDSGAFGLNAEDAEEFAKAAKPSLLCVPLREPLRPLR